VNFDNKDCRELEYKINIEFKLSDKVCFPNKNTLTVIDVEHAFYPDAIHGDWEGGLYG